MRFVVRELFYTKPGRRDEALARLRELDALFQQSAGAAAGHWQVRRLAAAFASPGQPDLIAEYELDELGEYVRMEEQLWKNPRFLEWNERFVELLSQAAKADVYTIET
jgi:hypothetical protein